MNQKIKQTIKLSGFVVACVRAARAAQMDVRRLFWTLRRGGIVRAYLAAHPLRKLQIGASHTPYPGWLNTDYIPERSDVVYLDATRPFPIPDASFDYVAFEHMIEHVDYAGGMAMLQECHRILKPGGKIRFATPDLRVLVTLIDPQPTPEAKKYTDFFIRRLMPQVDQCCGVFILNNAFRFWGHQFLYDRATLELAMARAGFTDLRWCRPGESEDPQLRGIESHQQCYDVEGINDFETMVIEARKK